MTAPTREGNIRTTDSGDGDSSIRALAGENAPKHTPTPWRVFKTTDGLKLVGIGAQDGQGILDAGFGVWAWNDAEGIANAELVVRTVNAHDDLVKALERARKSLAIAIAAAVDIPINIDEHDAIKAIDAALAKAGGAS